MSTLKIFLNMVSVLTRFTNLSHFLLYSLWKLAAEHFSNEADVLNNILL